MRTNLAARDAMGRTSTMLEPIKKQRPAIEIQGSVLNC